MKNNRSEKGFTMIELLVTMGIMTIVMLFVSSFFVSQRGILRKQRNVSEVARYSLTSIDYLNRSVMNAGYNVIRGTGIEAASDHYVVLVGDFESKGWVDNTDVIVLAASSSPDPTVGTEFVTGCESKAGGTTGYTGCLTAATKEFNFYFDVNGDHKVDSTEKVTINNMKLNLRGPPYKFYSYHVNTTGTGMATPPDAIESNVEYVKIKYLDINNCYIPSSSGTCNVEPYAPYWLNQNERRQVRKIVVELMTKSTSPDINISAYTSYKRAGNFPTNSIATYNSSGVPVTANTAYPKDGYLRRKYQTEVTPRNFIASVCGRVLLTVNPIQVACETDTATGKPKFAVVTAQVTDLYGEILQNKDITFNISTDFGSFTNTVGTRTTMVTKNSGSTGQTTVNVYHWQVPPQVWDRSNLLYHGPTPVAVNGSFIDDVNFNPACTAASAINVPYVAGPPARVAFVNPDANGTLPLYVRDPNTDGKYPYDLNRTGTQDLNGGVPVFGAVASGPALYYPPASISATDIYGRATVGSCGASTDTDLGKFAVEVQDMCGNPTALKYGSTNYRLKLSPYLIHNDGTVDTSAAFGRIRPWVDDTAMGWHSLPDQNNDKWMILKDSTDTCTGCNNTNGPGGASVMYNYNPVMPFVFSYAPPDAAHTTEYTNNLAYKIASPTIPLNYGFYVPSSPENRGTSDTVGRYVAGIFIEKNVIADLGVSSQSLVTTLEMAPTNYSSAAHATTWPIATLEPIPTRIVAPALGSNGNPTEASAEAAWGNKVTSDGFIDLRDCSPSGQGPVTLYYGLTDNCSNLVKPSTLSPAHIGNTVSVSIVPDPLYPTVTPGLALPATTIVNNSTPDFTPFRYTSPSCTTLTPSQSAIPQITLTLKDSGGTPIPGGAITLGAYGGAFRINSCLGACTMTATNYTDYSSAGYTAPPTNFTTPLSCQPLMQASDSVAAGSLNNVIQLGLGGYVTNIFTGMKVMFDTSMNSYTITGNTATTITTASNILAANLVAGRNFKIYDSSCFSTVDILEYLGTPLTSSLGSPAQVLLTPCNANAWINFGGCNQASGGYSSVEVILEPTNMSGGLVIGKNASLGNAYTSSSSLAPISCQDTCGWNGGDTTCGNGNDYDNIYNVANIAPFKIPISIGNATGFKDASNNLIETNIGVRAYFPNKAACNPTSACTPNVFSTCQGPGVTCYVPNLIRVTSECRQISACPINPTINAGYTPDCQSPNEIFSGAAVHMDGCSESLFFKVYDCNSNKNPLATSAPETVPGSLSVILKEGATQTDLETADLSETAASVVGSVIHVRYNSSTQVANSFYNSPLFTVKIPVTQNYTDGMASGSLRVPFGYTETMTVQYTDPGDSNDNKCQLTTVTLDWVSRQCIYGCLDAFNCSYSATPTFNIANSTNQKIWFSNYDCSKNTNVGTQQSGLILVEMTGTTPDIEIVPTSETIGTYTTPVASLSSTYPLLTGSNNSPFFAGDLPIVISNTTTAGSGSLELPVGGIAPGNVYSVTKYNSTAYSVSSVTPSPSRAVTISTSLWTLNQFIPGTGYYYDVYFPTKGNIYHVATNTPNSIVLTPVIEKTVLNSTNFPSGTPFDIYQESTTCAFTFNATVNARTTICADDFTARNTGNLTSYNPPYTTVPATAGIVTINIPATTSTAVSGTGGKMIKFVRNGATVSTVTRSVSTATGTGSSGCVANACTPNGCGNILLRGYFNHGITALTSSTEYPYIQVSTNGGGAWTTVYTFSNTNGQQFIVDLSTLLPAVDNNANVQIRLYQPALSATNHVTYFDDLEVLGLPK